MSMQYGATVGCNFLRLCGERRRHPFCEGDVTTQYWDFFPVPPEQEEFLFEVHSPAQSVLYFRVIRMDGDLRVINSTPDMQSSCLQFDKSFGGSIGADSVVSLQITR